MEPTTDSFGPLCKVSCTSNLRPSVSLQTPVLAPAMSFDLEEDDLEQSPHRSRGGRSEFRLNNNEHTSQLPCPLFIQEPPGCLPVAQQTLPREKPSIPSGNENLEWLQ